MRACAPPRTRTVPVSFAPVALNPDRRACIAKRRGFDPAGASYIACNARACNLGRVPGTLWMLLAGRAARATRAVRFKAAAAQRRMVFYAQVLGTDSGDTCPSLLLFSDQRRSATALAAGCSASL